MVPPPGMRRRGGGASIRSGRRVVLSGRTRRQIGRGGPRACGRLVQKTRLLDTGAGASQSSSTATWCDAPWMDAATAWSCWWGWMGGALSGPGWWPPRHSTIAACRSAFGEADGPWASPSAPATTWHASATTNARYFPACAAFHHRGCSLDRIGRDHSSAFRSGNAPGAAGACVYVEGTDSGHCFGAAVRGDFTAQLRVRARYETQTVRLPA